MYDSINFLNKTLMKHIQNNRKSRGKSIPAYVFKNFKKKSANLKSQTLCQMFVIYEKKTIPKGMNLKIYRKSIA
jgi:hypothetical protein